MATMPNPTFVYKLVHFSSPPPRPLPILLPLSKLDEDSGFIHLSTSIQVPGTLKHFFGNDPRVYLLKIPYTKVEKHIRWEDPQAQICGERGEEGMFPHLYNEGRLGSEEVDGVAMWEKTENGWDEVLEREKAWLAY